MKSCFIGMKLKYESCHPNIQLTENHCGRATTTNHQNLARNFHQLLLPPISWIRLIVQLHSFRTAQHDMRATT